MKLTQEKILELLWEHDGYALVTGCSFPDFNGTKKYLVFGAKLFMNTFGMNPQTGEQIFETREADEEETRAFIRRQIMMRKFDIREEAKPDFSKLSVRVSG